VADWKNTGLKARALRCIGGATQLTMKLAAALGPDRITHKAPIIAIRAKEREMVVSTADGEPHECDDVVLAVPPSMWKKIDFYPELPDGLRPQMGTALKYLATVKSAYWQGNRSRRAGSPTWKSAAPGRRPRGGRARPPCVHSPAGRWPSRHGRSIEGSRWSIWADYGGAAAGI